MYSTIRELLGHSDRWTKGTLARDRKGEPVLYMSTTACKWCVFGAMCHLGKDQTSVSRKLRESAVRLGIGVGGNDQITDQPLGVCLGKTNDTLSFDQLILWLEEAGV